MVVHDILEDLRESADELLGQQQKTSTDDPQHQRTIFIQSISGCVQLLHQCKDLIRAVLTHPNPEPDVNNSDYTDPRPTIAEAWFFSISSLLSIDKELTNFFLIQQDATFHQLVSETIALVVQLLCLKRLPKEKISTQNGICEKHNETYQIGMSLDGPQTLAMMMFLELALGIPVVGSGGESILRRVSHEFELTLKFGFEDGERGGESSINADLLGGALISSALYRGTSGGLPPWAVEDIPGVYSAMFHGVCQQNPQSFCEILRVGSNLRLFGAVSSDKNNASASAWFGAIPAGKKLAGRYIENMSSKAKETFLTKTRDLITFTTASANMDNNSDKTNKQICNSVLCDSNNPDVWRQFKVLLKAACGGKKKSTCYNLKPQVTNWECDRI